MHGDQPAAKAMPTSRDVHNVRRSYCTCRRASIMRNGMRINPIICNPRYDDQDAAGLRNQGAMVVEGAADCTCRQTEKR